MKKKFHHQKNEINKRTNELFAYTNEVNVLPMSLVNRIFFFDFDIERILSTISSFMKCRFLKVFYA